MIVIPAIDIKAGRCVRLQQGQMGKETVYSEFPEKMAEKWTELGAERIHIVDLDGAVQGSPINKATIEKIVRAAAVPIQLGGGIRDLQTIDAYLSLGISQVILGTAAIKNPKFVENACTAFPNRIIIGIDARKDQVAVEGWMEETDISPLRLANHYESFGISAIIYTDIHRDGMGTGPNLESTKKFAKAIKTPLIASGGISDLNDVAGLLALAKYGIVGMITGRALYKGTLDLVEAIRLAKNLANQEFF